MSKYIVTFSALGSYGRLGNEMFQIAAVYGYSKLYDMTPILKARNRDDIFPNYSKYIHTGEAKCDKVSETKFSYSKIPYLNKSIDLFGYFQSEKYFDHCSNDIKDMFSFSEEYEPAFESKRRLGVHIRRGDYVKLGSIYEDLYRAGYYDILSTLESQYDEILIFTDDVEFCKTAFPQYNTHSNETANEYSDMCALSKCTDIVMANSSFSWWASYLNATPGKRTFVPRRWFTDNKTSDDLYRSDMVII